MNKERLLLWIEALESDKYTQCHNALTSQEFAFGPASHCCLGVACVIAINHGENIIINRNYDNLIAYDENTVELPKSVIEWYGFDSDDPDLSDEEHVLSCISCNDKHRMSFKKIAQLLRKKYL